MRFEHEIPKVYEPKSVEEKIYSQWEEGGYFKPEANPGGKPFTIVMPPPNITGQLHIGHAYNNTLQDILIRFKRMHGYKALWLPGEDHASIATEVRVLDKVYREEGLTKDQLGREEFLRRTREWSDFYRKTIAGQLRKLGSSCDWSRERFTMDEGCSAAVKEAFIRLYNNGRIYRDNRIINWCPDCRTALSDAEVEYEEETGHLWHIRYPIKGSSEYITVATTRPETMLGDTAVAVNPDDDRFKSLIGKVAILPLMNREIPIIGDSYVDIEYGTGCVKITPCHDINDFEVGKRHNLDKVLVLDEQANVNENGGKYCGLNRYDAREEIIKDLSELGLLAKTEEISHSIGHCYRCNEDIEPITSLQWFVSMQELAEPALEVVYSGQVTFVPDRFKKIYFQWMENIRDWCISRQLWWGHRIPAYYCESCGETVVAAEDPASCPKCGSDKFIQDEDVLDTWFSSALWPFSTLGWPEATQDLAEFYPNDVLVTAQDIIFFWVARMIFSGLEYMGEIPFSDVFINGIVRDELGRKMSKSLDNGVDPLELIELYGADAVRCTLVTGVGAGNDQRWQDTKVQASRNFCNKINNAARFIQMNLDGYDPGDANASESMDSVDIWIRSKLNDTISEVTANIEKYEFGLALGKLYSFVWNDFCDWYIEFVKPRLFSDDKAEKKAAQHTLYTAFMSILKLLHPFMPYITESIYQIFAPGQMLIVAKWPEPSAGPADHGIVDEVEEIIEAIRGIRNTRTNMNIPPSTKAKLYIAAASGSSDKYLAYENAFKRLAGASEVLSIDAGEAEKLGNSSKVTTLNAVYILPLDSLIDKQAELSRLNKEKDKIQKDIERSKSKLENSDFIKKAPENIVSQERSLLHDFEALLDGIEQSINELS
ncbi:MAG: valine--tRNA ligase [Eubacteriaceae bacterium]|nr:valine--tRNA ligase [Eubacteriaceae bacterium]